uniref:protein disulfide-isomerase n=1 Tax=Anthurium amnicola TaxID=1678845 RepID=A0A1D1YGF8_9ARAE
MISPRRRPATSGIAAAALLLLLLTQALADAGDGGGGDDLDELEELLAIEDEEERKGAAGAQGRPSEAEVLSRAQGIVLELSNDNARRVVEGSEYVLVLGYAPWCPNSAVLMPRFAEAATALRGLGSPLVMAKLDAERHAKAASLLGVKGFPTLLLFVNGSAQPYTGGFTGEEIVIWAQKKTGAPIIRLHSVTAAEEFLRRHQTFVIALFEKFEGLKYEEFVKAAVTDNDIQFVVANDLNVAKILFPEIKAGNHFLGLVKSESEMFVEFGESFEEDKILHFIEFNKYPLVTTLTDLNSARVFASPITLQVFVFAEAADLKHLLASLLDAARKYKTKIMFIYVDSTEDNLAKPFLSLFGVEADKPVVAAFDNKIGSKYLLESDLTPENLEVFCAGLLDGTLAPYSKSESVPVTTDNVRKIVGRTFTSAVLDSSEHFFLEVYSPWCIDCEETSKQVEKLAKLFKGLNNLVFGRIDASLNEHPKLQVDNFPTLIFYPSGDKSNPIKLSKKSSLKELITFLKKTVTSEDGKTPTEGQIKDEL